MKSGHIVQAIELLTGLKPVEIDRKDTYILSLGIKRPLTIGFDKVSHVGVNIEDLKYSAHVKMLSTISDMMCQDGDFTAWVEGEK